MIYRHSLKKQFKCSNCDASFTKRPSLKKHICIDKIGKQFQCEYCTLIFNSNVKMKYHISREHENTHIDHPCTYCDKTYNQKKELERHILQIHEKRLDYKCEYCGKDFAIESQVTRHVKLIHTGKSLSEALLFTENVVYKNCSECQLQFLYTTCSPQV